MINFESINTLPTGVKEYLFFLEKLDLCFLTGFSRLSEEQKETLESLRLIFQGTAFEEQLRDALEAFERSRFQVEYFRTIAAVRSALHGACHDALQEQLATILERKYQDVPEVSFQETTPPLLKSSEEWLMELAITGFEQLQEEHLAPFHQTLDNLLETPELIRQAALLSGFINELSGSTPIGSMKKIPLRRWVDLWAKAMTNAVKQPEPLASEQVSGDLLILGVDLRQHNHCVQLQAHALLQSEEKRLVRVNLSTFKVDSIVEHEIWKLFSPYPIFLEALAKNRGLRLKEMPLLASGDLLWEEELAELTEEFNAIQTVSEALADTTFYKQPALERHYSQIAEPVFLENYKFKEEESKAELFNNENTITIDQKRLSPSSLLDLKMLKGSTGCFGLLRFDAEAWTLQPLAVLKKIKKKDTVIHNGTTALGLPGKKPKKSAKPTEPLEILQERASRLLR